MLRPQPRLERDLRLELELALVSVPLRQSDCGLEGIADLPSVPRGFRLRQLLIMLRGELEDAFAIGLVNGELVAPDLASAVNVHFPDFDSGIFLHPGIEETHMDSTAESLVKRPDTVGSEEEDTGVVFEDPEEYRDDCIAFEISLAPCFKEYIGFV